MRSSSRYQAGSVLPADVRRKAERFFDADFSGVRIHVGRRALSLGAAAFTQGSHIHFAPGRYQPGTPEGLRLLGHELTHVLQQRTGRVTCGTATGAVLVQDAGLEAEADRMGELFAGLGSPRAAELAWVHAPALAPGEAAAEIIQRALPSFGAAETLGWEASSDYKKQPYLGDDRLGVSAFNETFKKAALKRWKELGIVDRVKTSFAKIRYARVESMETKGPLWAPLAGTGLDHRVSAHEIGKALLAEADRLALQIRIARNLSPLEAPNAYKRDYYGLFEISSGFYVEWTKHRRSPEGVAENLEGGKYAVCPTRYAAIMYYHDFPNLIPMLSRDNSSKNSASSTDSIVVPSKKQRLVEEYAYKLLVQTHDLVNINWNVTDLDEEQEKHLDNLILNTQKFLSLLQGFQSKKAIGSPYIGSASPYRSWE